MPSRPPSPPATDSDSRCTSVTFRPSTSEPGPTFRIRAVSRSVTSAAPSGRNAMPHGTSSPLASTVTTTSCSPGEPEPAELEGLGRLGGSPATSGSGGPKAHPVLTASTAPRVAATARARRLTPPDFTPTRVAAPAGTSGPVGSRSDRAGQSGGSGALTCCPPAASTAGRLGRGAAVRTRLRAGATVAPSSVSRCRAVR